MIATTDPLTAARAAALFVSGLSATEQPSRTQAETAIRQAFTARAGEVERLNYAFSVLHCLPATMAESTAVANGTVLRAPTVRDWAQRAGFGSVDVLPIEYTSWRFCRLAS